MLPEKLFFYLLFLVGWLNNLPDVTDFLRRAKRRSWPEHDRKCFILVHNDCDEIQLNKKGGFSNLLSVTLLLNHEFPDQQIITRKKPLNWLLYSSFLKQIEIKFIVWNSSKLDFHTINIRYECVKNVQSWFL